MSSTTSPGLSRIRTDTLQRITDVPSAEWNRVVGNTDPFLRHEFLAALERHHCVGERYGWLPHHIICRDTSNRLIGAVPCYLKDNSYGEFVFDWAWADAWQRAGKHYYPKLVSAIPYTPVTGSRLLIDADAPRELVIEALLKHAMSLLDHTGASSFHWLFTDDRDTDMLVRNGYLRRTGCNFHWRNPGYSSFDDFLADLSSRKRKKIRRERRHVRDAGISMKIVPGSDSTEAQWQIMHQFYCSTFNRKSGMATLSQGFFMEISETMGEQVLLVFAYHQGKPVAGAIMLRSDNALYGRHWGCNQDFHSLHFETCYYQGIEYCIEQGLTLFEPGAQGEHKISRGFLPTLTWSAHWIADQQFREAIDHYLQHEHELMLEYRDDMQKNSPFRETEPHAGTAAGMDR